MKYTGLNDLRESFLAFFESKGHLRLKSASLIPADDNSVLLINAGMTPLKKYFRGLEQPPNKRAASCQKCIRTPDIENVGLTARHGTFFEMLGNFSFGDYFKEDACKWAWEYFTVILEIPPELLWVSVFEEDDEAVEIWVNKVGIAPERIVMFGKADNFWEHGSGPCGPCSEIYFDRGADKGCGKADCKVGCDCDRYIEVWNLVFTQYDSDGRGNYTTLANKNIDTGMGLERLACVMQGVDNLFEVDTIKSVIGEIGKISGKNYNGDAKSDVSFRVITDHIRSGSFMIADGVLPSNEGRGYVLRRLLRRAARHGRLLGITRPFLFELCDEVIENSGGAYPELKEKRGYIKNTVKAEEESFLKTVEKGLELLGGFIANCGENRVISGEDVFKLHDTYGFPVDLTREILAENALSFNESEFKELMQSQKDNARARKSFKAGWDDTDAFAAGALSALKTTFTGYNSLIETTKILAIVKDGASADECSSGEKAAVILENTPFYAESGGQVGDTGEIFYDDGTAENVIEVTDTKKTQSGQFVCYGVVKSGVFRKYGIVTASVNAVRRRGIARNHTAAHLLQAALRNTLGEQVHQAGSLVEAGRCRFDFTYGQPLTPDEIAKVEDFVNISITCGSEVITEELPIEEAKKRGATALFGEKYGNTVRVVTVPAVSSEFCGGTHVKNTIELGLFKIVSESSAAAGVRRIEAVTGRGVMKLLNSANEIIGQAAAALKATPQNLVQKCASVMGELRDLQREVERLSEAAANSRTYDFMEIGEKDGVKLLTLKLPDADINALRKAGDRLKNGESAFVCVMAGQSNFYCLCGKAAVEKGFNAGEIVKKTAAITGGKGGGKADSAVAGIGDSSKVDEALAAVAG